MESKEKCKIYYKKINNLVEKYKVHKKTWGLVQIQLLNLIANWMITKLN